jgi:FlaG/FlaF family flagellin (archaellin)
VVFVSESNLVRWSKTSEITTNNQGIAQYNVNLKKAGNQKLTITYAGDKNYAVSEISSTVKISKEKTKITAKKKTFKKSKKVKKFTITLKNSKGKGIKGLKVVLKIKNKKYARRITTR